MPSKRPCAQIVVSLLPGSEPWILVRHQSGSFKLPMHADVAELLEGALKGWTQTPPDRGRGEPNVRVPLSQFLARWKHSGLA